MIRHYAGVGSRETPKHMAAPLRGIAESLAKLNFKLYTGGARIKKSSSDAEVCSADQEFEFGAHHGNGTVEVIRPNGIYTPIDWKTDVTVMTEAMYIEAYTFLTEGPDPIIPWWDKMKTDHKLLHARNYWQIMTKKGPVAFVVCWAKLDDKGEPSGGTRTAIKIAERLGVKVYNLYNSFDMIMIKTLIAGIEQGIETDFD